MCVVWAEGPCLVHTITGDLLRALDGPESCLCPRLISVSSEGHCVICYERGRFCNFSINGKLLAQMEVNDSTRVGGPQRGTHATHLCAHKHTHTLHTHTLPSISIMRHHRTFPTSTSLPTLRQTIPYTHTTHTHYTPAHTLT